MTPNGVLLAGLDVGSLVAGGFAVLERTFRNRWAADQPPECCGTVEWTGERPFGRRAADDSWWSCLGCGSLGYVEDGRSRVVDRLGVLARADKQARTR